MAFIRDAALDALLDNVGNVCDGLYITSQEATTLTEAVTTYALGNKSSPTVGAAGNATPNGRKRTISAITDGSVTATGTATHIALVDVGTALLATRALSSSQSVTSGNTFTLTEFDIRVPDAA